MQAETERLEWRTYQPRDTNNHRQSPEARREVWGRFFLRDSQRNQPCPNLDVYTSGLQNCQRVICIILVTQFVLICYSIAKRLIHSVSSKLSHLQIDRGGEGQITPCVELPPHKKKHEDTSPKIIKAANIFWVLAIPAFVLSGFIKNRVRDYAWKGNSRPRGKLCGVFPTHTLLPLFLYSFHSFHGHLV